MMITPCQGLFGLDRGREIHELLETATGDTCPCLSGGQCPLIPQQQRRRLKITGAVRRAAAEGRHAAATRDASCVTALLLLAG